MPNEQESQPSTGPQGPYKPVVPESVEPQPISEGASDEPDDSVLRSASSDVGDELGVPPPEDFKSKGGKGKKVFLLLFLLALIAGGAAAYYFLVYKKPAPAPVTETPVETPAANTFTPENVAYAYREKNADPFGIFLRPVAGGDRVEAGELSKDIGPNIISDVYGQNVVIVADNKLQVSRDGGKSYTQILETEAGQKITGAVFSTNGTKLGVAVLNTDEEQNTVSSMGLDGQGATEILTTKDYPGLLLKGWNDTSVIFNAYTLNSDSPVAGPYHYSIESKKTTEIVKPGEDMEIVTRAVSDDLSKVVYAEGKPNTTDGIGAAPLAPHTVKVVDVTSGESETIATVGKAGEKATNGTSLERNTLVGFMVNSNVPYYTDEGSLYTVDGAAPTLAYETKNDIYTVSFVSDTSIIISSGHMNDFVLANYNISSKEATTILEGDGETFIFGVTTK